MMHKFRHHGYVIPVAHFAPTVMNLQLPATTHDGILVQDVHADPSHAGKHDVLQGIGHRGNGDAF